MRLSVIWAAVSALLAGHAVAADLVVELDGNRVPINSSRLKQRLEVAHKAGPAEVTTPKLIRDYEENEVSADRRYKGKWLYVSGAKLGDISKGMFGGIKVTLPTDEYGLSFVSADLFSEQLCDASREKGFTACPAEEHVTKFKKGQRVDLECRGAGSAMKLPMLKDCLLLRK